MAYVVLVAIGCALGAGVWFPWRKRRPLTVLRVCAVVVIAAATGAGIWIGYEMEGVERGADAAARGFSNIGVGWH